MPGDTMEISVRHHVERNNNNNQTNETTKPVQNFTMTNVTVQTLDSMAKTLGWYDNDNDDIAILKVDVEGREVNVLEGAQSLLRSQRIHNIFLEGNVGDGVYQEKFRRLVTNLVALGYHAYKIGTWMGPTRTDFPPPTASDDYAGGLIWACRGFGRRRKAEQCNMWWKRATDLQQLQLQQQQQQQQHTNNRTPVRD